MLASHRVVFAAFAAFVLTGCCATPWKAFPRATMPDKQFSTGPGTHGFDVYVWECHGTDAERTVVFQFSAEMTCESPQRQTSACGAKTEFETKLGNEPQKPRRGEREWRTP